MLINVVESVTLEQGVAIH